MRFNPYVFDIWVFRRVNGVAQFLLLHTSQIKADRHFNGGRYWQIPSSVFETGESVPDAVDRVLTPYALRAHAIWAAEHTYTIYNRRFDEIQVVSVFAAEVPPEVHDVLLDPEEHAEHQWLGYDDAEAEVHYRGLKDGLKSTQEYVTGVAHPARELQLR